MPNCHSCGHYDFVFFTTCECRIDIEGVVSRVGFTALKRGVTLKINRASCYEMSAGFPFLLTEYNRVIFAKNPLIEVIAQIRFPTILKIETKSPAQFQELIADDYPILEIAHGVDIGFPSKPGDPQRPFRPHRSYLFRSPDEREWQVALAPDFIALSTPDYRKWEDFEERLSRVIEALLQSYSVRRFSRIGLRYQNVIDRQELALADTKWSDLIKPAALGWLTASDELAAKVTSFTSTTLFANGEDQVRLQSGLVQDTNTRELAFLLDFDYFIDKNIESNLGRVQEHAARLYSYSGPFFSWCIEPRLRAALGPS